MKQPRPRPWAVARGARLGAGEQLVVGGLAGSLEVFINQPTVALKNAMQGGRPLPWRVPELYRGVVVNAGSMAPITAVQFGASAMIAGMMGGPGEVSSAGRVGAAAAAGALSGLISGPAELVMIRQQLSGRSLTGELRHLVGTHGPRVLGSGLGLAMGRDGLYTCGYMGLTPVFKELLEPRFEEGSSAPFLGAGIAAGVMSALMTHPVDTVKTIVQTRCMPGATVPEGVPTSVSGVTAEVWAKGGVAGFYSGVLPRSFRLITAVFILNMSKDEIEKRWLELKDKSS